MLHILVGYGGGSKLRESKREHPVYVEQAIEREVETLASRMKLVGRHMEAHL